MIKRAGFCLILCLSYLPSDANAQQASPTRAEANAALGRAVRFFRQDVSTEGGYLWQYSADLSQREGEGKATATQVWVQSPGTPAVGLTLLNAYRRTGEKYLLEAARDAAEALVRGQLVSGGWDYRIEFDSERRSRYAYRIEDQPSKGRNTSTLDDDTTQSALRFLMQIDMELEFKDAAVHQAVEYALASLLRVQYPNGAWPQRYVEPLDPDDYPVKQASYPDSWSRTFSSASYKTFYTFNDNTIADTIRTMMDAARIYEEPRYQSAAEKAGQFILLAQMPDPQPAWAQQYNEQMHPAWARKFEPPAVTGGESQGVMSILIDLYEQTGNREFLEPIPRAVEYLRSSERSDGRLARFYELKTNKPLYFNKDYKLTYVDTDMPTHYAFIVSSRLDTVERRYANALNSEWEAPKLKQISTRPVRSARQTQQVQTALQSLDSRGAWVEDGTLKYQEGPANGRIIRCQTFMQNVNVLSQYMGKE